MLQWTAAGTGARFMGLVHHTDAVREWAYDRTSAVGRLDKALDEAEAKAWTVVSMKDDWKRIPVRREIKREMSKALNVCFGSRLCKNGRAWRPDFVGGDTGADLADRRGTISRIDPYEHPMMS